MRSRVRRWLTVAALLSGGTGVTVPPAMQGRKVGNHDQISFWVEVGIACVGGLVAIGLAVVVLVSLRNIRAPGTMAAAIVAAVLGGLALLVAAVLMFSG